MLSKSGWLAPDGRLQRARWGCCMQWLADRFFTLNGAWIDAASGLPVRILISPAAGHAFDWDEQCARLARIRHPLVNPLIDYGPAPDGRRFEAYVQPERAVEGGLGAAGLLAHTTQFLRQSGVTMEGERARLAMREVAGRGRPPRGLGITLQPRRALPMIHEMLEAPSAASIVITVVGPSQSGLRTLRYFVARSARLLGYMPVCASMLSHGGVDFAAIDRHLCVLDGEDASPAGNLAEALVKLAAASARRNVVIRFRRFPVRRAMALDPMSVRSLMGMVFVPPAGGPSEQELFEAARLADGRPGAFLAKLAGSQAADRPASAMVHEMPGLYAQDPPPGASTEPPHRTLRSALGAIRRAGALAERGRHAAARRLLLRASRVLAGRSRGEEAAECLVRAGFLALNRGRTSEAVPLFEEARKLAAGGSAALHAAVGHGEAWTDDSRFVEAEALLRGTLAAAEAAGHRRHATASLAALVRCLNEQGRAADAVAVAGAVEWSDDDPAATRLLAELSRSHRALGRTAAAVHLARRAEKMPPDETTHAAVDLALAEALATAGDTTGMRDALARVRRRARTVHLPLAAIAARVIAATNGEAGNGSAATVRSARQLRGLARLPLPRLYRARIAMAVSSLTECGNGDRMAAEARDIRLATTDALENLLQICHEAPDEASALTGVCAATLQKVGAATAAVVTSGDHRVLAAGGRAWTAGSSAVVLRALASGQPCSSDAASEPREAAEPVRYGGDVIATIACRWTAGAPADAIGVAGVLRGASLAIASSVRSLLDRAAAMPAQDTWGDLMGSSAPAAALRDAVARAARAPFPVLVEGESGSGKELVARAIHRLGLRRERRFCAINCAALTDELIEAELFGHARGAFTGASSERAGLFEEADGGTLFLDEVSELSARAQAKLLRVLQEGEVRRVGENFARRVDPRIIAATNRKLTEEVSAGRFRADLRFRLDVVRISVPPLRDRPEDVPVLAAHFWNDASKRVDSRATLTGDTLAALARFDWPGNVRELQNVIASMAVHSPRRGRIGASALPGHLARSTMPEGHGFAAAREDFERRFVRAAIAGANGQMSKAAQALGVSRQGLSKMMRRLQIEPPSKTAAAVRP